MRNARRWRVVLAGAAFVVAVAACSSEPEATAPTLELSTTTVTTLPPTTVTTEAPTTTLDPRIAEVEAAVAGLRTIQTEVLLVPTTNVDTLGGFASGELLGSLQNNTLQSRAEGRTFEGDFERRTVEITWLSEAEASLIECGHDRVSVVAADGEVIVAADAEAVLREIFVSRSDADGVWRVTQISFVGEDKQSCGL